MAVAKYLTLSYASFPPLNESAGCLYFNRRIGKSSPKAPPRLCKGSAKTPRSTVRGGTADLFLHSNTSKPNNPKTGKTPHGGAEGIAEYVFTVKTWLLPRLHQGFVEFVKGPQRLPKETPRSHRGGDVDTIRQIMTVPVVMAECLMREKCRYVGIEKFQNSKMPKKNGNIPPKMTLKRGSLIAYYGNKIRPRWMARYSFLTNGTRMVICPMVIL